MTRSISAAGRAALMGREGCRLKAYPDSVGVPTIGVGHTGRAGPPAVELGMAITQAEAEEIFAADLQPFEEAVDRAVTVAIGQTQFDALVSLAFNIGVNGFAGSTVVHKLNAGQIAAAADAFLMWVHPPELRRRRIAERAQFLAMAPQLETGVSPARRVAPAKTPSVQPATSVPRPASEPPRRLGWLDRLWIMLTFRKAA